MDLVCKACNELFDGESSFIDHFMDKHTARESIEEIIQERSIQQITSNAAPLCSSSICVCDICFKSTSDMDTLAAHILTHVGALPYFCESCDFSTISKLHLKQHLLRHEDDTTIRRIAHLNFEEFHECEGCNAHFPSWKELVCHYVHHLKSMPFTCKECSMMFNEKRDLKIHNHLHNYSLMCDICHHLCNSRVNLLLHVLTHDPSKYFGKFSDFVDAKRISVTKACVPYENLSKFKLGVSDSNCSGYDKTIVCDTVCTDVEKPWIINSYESSDSRLRNTHPLRLQGVISNHHQNRNRSVNCSTRKDTGCNPPYVKAQWSGNNLKRTPILLPSQSKVTQKTLLGNLTKVAPKKLPVHRSQKLSESFNGIKKKDTGKRLTLVKLRSAKVSNRASSPQNQPVTARQAISNDAYKEPEMKSKTSQKSSPLCVKNSENMKTVSVVLQRLPSYVHDMASYQKYCQIQEKRNLKNKESFSADKQKGKLQKQSKQNTKMEPKPLRSNSHLENMQKNLARFNKIYNISSGSHLYSEEVCKAEGASVGRSEKCQKTEEGNNSSSINTKVQSKSEASDISVFSKAATFKTLSSNLVDENCLRAERWKDKSIVDKLVNTAVKIQRNLRTVPMPLSRRDHGSVRQAVSQSSPDLESQLSMVKSLRECSVILYKLPGNVTDMLSYEKYATAKENEMKYKPLAPLKEETVASGSLRPLEGESITDRLGARHNNSEHSENQNLATPSSPRLKYWSSPRTGGKDKMAMNCNDFKSTNEMPALCSTGKESNPSPGSDQKSLLKNNDPIHYSETNQKSTEFSNSLPSGKRKRIGAKSNYLKQMTSQKLMRTSQFLSIYSEPKKCLKSKKRIHLKTLFNKDLLLTRTVTNCAETSTCATKERNSVHGLNIQNAIEAVVSQSYLNDSSSSQSNSPLSGSSLSHSRECLDSSSDDSEVRLSSNPSASLSCNAREKCRKKVKNEVERRKKHFALSNILPSAKVAKHPNKKKPQQLNRSTSNGVFPNFNSKPDFLDSTIPLRSIRNRISDIRVLLKCLRSGNNNSSYFSGSKIPVVKLSRLPDSVYRKYLKGKPIMLSNVMAELQNIQTTVVSSLPTERFNSLQTERLSSLQAEQECPMLNDHSYCRKSVNRVLLEHNYAAKFISIERINFRKDFSLSL